MTRWMFVILGVVVALVGSSTHASGQDTDVSKLAQQCSAIGGDQDAAWRTVDWQTDLITAQRMAVEQQKPLFIWAMDGHPLGCT